MAAIGRRSAWGAAGLLVGLLAAGPVAEAQFRPGKGRDARPKAAEAAPTAEATETPGAVETPGADPAGSEFVVKTDAEWRAVLSPMQYWVTRQKGTEQAWTGRYARGHFKGVFTCVGCAAPLFSSTHKFESGTGWPSFWRPARAEALESAWDRSTPELRVEVSCRRCGAHLGHVFRDGPPPTGLRYCINSAALKLEPFSESRAATAVSSTDADPAAVPTPAPPTDAPAPAPAP